MDHEHPPLKEALGITTFILAKEVIGKWTEENPEVKAQWLQTSKLNRGRFTLALSQAMKSFSCRNPDCWLKVLLDGGEQALKDLCEVGGE